MRHTSKRGGCLLGGRVAEPVCPSCSGICPDGACFCPSCGASLSRRPPARAGATERRIITVLFCDLVGFTAMCERADPEDVDLLLRSYHRLTRHVIEQYGGVLEKFIGDGVVGAFGTSVAHEDDAERAVRAAVRLQARVAELTGPHGAPLLLRIGINTGEALVRLDVDPASGEGFLAGDAVNTASRLQTIAPPGGTVIGELTRSLVSGLAGCEAMSRSSLLKARRARHGPGSSRVVSRSRGRPQALVRDAVRRPRGRTRRAPRSVRQGARSSAPQFVV